MTTGWRHELCIFSFALAALSMPEASLANGQGGYGFGGGASCTIERIISAAPTVANLGTYVPPAVPAAVAVNMTVTLRTSGSGRCDGAIAFRRWTAPATMAAIAGNAVRGYTIQSAANGTSLMFFGGGENPGNNRLDFSVTPHNNSATITFTVYVTAQGGWLAAGGYSDNIYLKVFNRSGSQVSFADFRDFSLTSQVQQACNLPPPSQQNLNFTSAISNGLPNTTILTVTFSGVACSAPARIRLSGDALKNPGIHAVANFDNFINWRANATFGAANVGITTNATTTVQATSATQNVLSGPTTSATITVNVNLLAGHRIIAGHYSNILTVTIDPAL
jgi:hypothetical protein